MLLVSKTYEVITHESAEYGEPESFGFVFQDEPMTFSELVNELRRYNEPSQSHGCSEHTWFTQYGDQDYKDGSYTNESLHFSNANNPIKAKYWVKAAHLAGLIK